MLQKMKKRLKDQKGMTLIELLAVIVILGIVAAIAIPSISGIITKSRNDAKVAEGIQIISAAKLYVTAHPLKDGVNTITLGDDVLADSLDNLKDSNFDVTVNKDATSGKYSYELTDHESGALVGGKDATSTEADLLAY